MASHSTRFCTASSTSSCPVCTGSAGRGSLADTGAALGIASISDDYPLWNTEIPVNPTLDAGFLSFNK
jgi:hypothetical protein